MSKDNSEPAFPIVVGDQMTPGMTLRDYFAAKALNVISGAHTPEDLATWDYHHFAEFAYRVADAMLAERDK